MMTRVTASTQTGALAFEIPLPPVVLLPEALEAPGGEGEASSHTFVLCCLFLLRRRWRILSFTAHGKRMAAKLEALRSLITSPRAMKLTNLRLLPEACHHQSV